MLISIFFARVRARLQMPLLGARTIIRISSSGEDELTMRIWGATKGRGTPRLWGHELRLGKLHLSWG